MRSPNALKGITLVLCAMALLPFIDVCAKYLGQQGVPVVQMVWARFLFGTLFTLPFALRLVGWNAFVPTYLVLNLARTLFLIAGTAFFFIALRTLPIADTLALYFVQPILITALSPILLGEKVGIRRWTSVVIGFVGVLIIIRPGFQAMNPGTPFGLLSGTMAALYVLVTRHLSGKADAMLTTFQTSAYGALAMSFALPWFFEMPDRQQWLLLMLLGGVAIAGHYLVTRAYDYAEASLLSPFNYTEMIMAIAVGWYFFGDFPDAWTFLGVAILIACAIYISWRENVVRGRTTPT